MNKTFYVYYYRSWGCENYEQRKLIISCESRGVALGIVLEKYPKTEPQYWGVCEVDTEHRCLYDLDEYFHRTFLDNDGYEWIKGESWIPISNLPDEYQYVVILTDNGGYYMEYEGFRKGDEWFEYQGNYPEKQLHTSGIIVGWKAL